MKTEELIKTKIDKWDALIYLEENEFTIAYSGRGGAIVSDSSYKKAEKKFIRAMKLSEFAKKCMIYHALRAKK